jgi:hypothetical protein
LPADVNRPFPDWLVELWPSFIFGSYNGAMVVFLTEIIAMFFCLNCEHLKLFRVAGLISLDA